MRLSSGVCGGGSGLGSAYIVPRKVTEAESGLLVSMWCSSTIRSGVCPSGTLSKSDSPEVGSGSTFCSELLAAGRSLDCGSESESGPGAKKRKLPPLNVFGFGFDVDCWKADQQYG
jgi:hypothetical protein